MNSVLLIGYSRFTDGLRSQVRGLDALTVTAVNSVLEAVLLVEKATPDVIIIQSCLLRASSVSKTFGCHQIAHIVIVETAAIPAYDIERLTILQLEKNASALESGADAYLWLPFQAEEIQPEEIQSGVSSKDFARELTLPGKHEEFVQETSATPVSTAASKPLSLATSSEPAVAAALAKRAFTASQCRLIQAHIQIGLSRAQRYRDLSRINDWLSAVALVDALTQINNRRALDLELPNQIRMANANATPLSLMVLDIDYFKSVNDRFGHLVGDDILKQLAKRLLANMRFYDTPFRFGGEEFVITLNNTDAVEGSMIANRIREIIADEPFTLTHPVNNVSKLAITVSIGLSELRSDDDEQGRSLLDRADKNLLIAKSSGRNQVVCVSQKGGDRIAKAYKGGMA